MKKKFAYILFILAFIIGIFVSVLILYFVRTYTITYDTQGGSLYKAITVRPGDKIVLPEEPYMAGYIFEGWYVNDEKIDSKYRVYEDVTLVAKYKSILEENSQ